jgi:ankyrin repeat protein
MLAAGWPLDGRGQHGGTALHWAAWHGNAAMVRELLRYHAAVNVKGDDHRLNPLGWALHGSGHSWHRQTGDYAGVVEALLAAGATAPERPDGFEASEEALAALQAAG